MNTKLIVWYNRLLMPCSKASAFAVLPEHIFPAWLYRLRDNPKLKLGDVTSCNLTIIEVVMRPFLVHSNDYTEFVLCLIDYCVVHSIVIQNMVSGLKLQGRSPVKCHTSRIQSR